MQYLRLILVPFSWIYGFIVFVRNLAYDTRILPSRRFNIPVISVGNLAVGGAGKSPVTEYLIRLLKDRKRVAVLSRGYGRKTKGFRFVQPEDPATLSGDEPLQFRRKFSKITVAVAEKRVEGIEKLKDHHDVIVLDDAYQHRAVSPGLSILLFDYTRLDDFMLMLPAGNFREPFSGRKRADILMITKTPVVFPPEERIRLTKFLNPFKHQSVFFSYLEYGNLTGVYTQKELDLTSMREKECTIFLLTGIANPSPLLNTLKNYSRHIRHYEYPDHHPFSRKNISKLAEDFMNAEDENKLVITTEKDAQRLLSPELSPLLSSLPVYYLPVKARLHEPDEKSFNYLIENYVSEHLQHNGIH